MLLLVAHPKSWQLGGGRDFPQKVVMFLMESDELSNEQKGPKRLVFGDLLGMKCPTQFCGDYTTQLILVE